MLAHDKPVANPLVVLRQEFDDWAVLFDPDTGDAFGLNPTSVLIWNLLDGRHTKKDILRSLHENAQGVPHEAEDHLGAFIQDLVDRGLAGYETETA
jgi:SynChlorMet cassette protein ScmD